MDCHSDKDLTKKRNGKDVSMFVDEAKFKASVHQDQKCSECHAGVAKDHPDDEKAIRIVDCARCHEKEPREFETSVHGMALKAGNEAAATCKDCHGGPHEVVSPRLVDSPLSHLLQSQTCGACHSEEAADLELSVHGKANAKGMQESPSCTDCHSEHSIRSFSGKGSSLAVSETCSRCHESERMNTKFKLPSDRVKTFFESYHGLAIKGGATNAANCASCHGFHKILRSTDPESSINRRHLVETCGKCHPGAGENFSFGEVHLRDTGEGSMGASLNYWVRVMYLVLIFGVVGGMLLHNGLSWMRALRVAYHARGKTVTRMNLHQRVQHLVLVISFIVLALTGFALKYPESWLAWMLGSDEAIRRWLHRASGVMMLGGGVWHVIYLVGTRDGRKLAKDMMLGMRDLWDLVGNLMYFVGKRPAKPQFARFGYAEKIEYWAVIWGTIIMGVTGLMIWLKIDVTHMFPRWVIDLATTVHFYEAILACLAIVVWHFYHVLFAPSTYPMNFAWWDGKVSKKWHEEEHGLEQGDHVDGLKHEKKHDPEG